VAAETIRAIVPRADLEVLPLDLASLASVRQFAQIFKQTYHSLHLLINNAGVLLVPYGETQDGFERHFGVNHLGHFALTGLLIDRILGTPGSRILTVSSRGHAAANLDGSELLETQRGRYCAWSAYARSKLANLLFTYELQRRVAETGTMAVAAHPGGAATGLGRDMNTHGLYRAILPLLGWLSQSAAQGARPILRAATDPEAIGGQFYGPGGRLGMRGHPVVVRSSRLSYDETLARQIWKISEELTGVRFS
jgi:NAD(P)-dependent dehydrogenase (short-subunit alcohol dehydrogenase family)